MRNVRARVFSPDLTFLQSLNLTKMVTCRLNPLKVCLPVVAQNFAAVTRTYQLAYCYSVLQHNARYSMPVIHQDKGCAVTRESTLLDTFFPFDPFILRRSVNCSHNILCTTNWHLNPPLFLSLLLYPVSREGKKQRVLKVVLKDSNFPD